MFIYLLSCLFLNNTSFVNFIFRTPSPPEQQNIPTSEPDSSSNGNEPMLTDPSSPVKECLNESDETESANTRRLSSTVQNLDTLGGLELLSSVSLAVCTESPAQPVNAPTDSLDVPSAMQSQATPTPISSTTTDSFIPVSSADHLERAYDLLGLSRTLTPSASTIVSSFMGPRTLEHQNLADAHEKALRASSDMQLVEQRARGSNFTCFTFSYNLLIHF